MESWSIKGQLHAVVIIIIIIIIIIKIINVFIKIHCANRRATIYMAITRVWENQF